MFQSVPCTLQFIFLCTHDLNVVVVTCGRARGCLGVYVHEHYVCTIIAEPEGEASNLDSGLTVHLYVCI